MNSALKAIIELCIEEDLLPKSLDVLEYLLSTTSIPIPACYIRMCITLLVHPEYPTSSNIQESCNWILQQVVENRSKINFDAWSFENDLSDNDMPKENYLKIFSNQCLFTQDVDYWDLIAYMSSRPPDLERWMSLMDIWLRILEIDAEENGSALMKKYMGEDLCELQDAIRICFSCFTLPQQTMESPFATSMSKAPAKTESRGSNSFEGTSRLANLGAKLLCLIWAMLPKGRFFVVHLTDAFHFLSKLDERFSKLNAKQQDLFFGNLGASNLRYCLSQYILMKGIGIGINIRHTRCEFTKQLTQLLPTSLPKNKIRQKLHLRAWVSFLGSALRESDRNFDKELFYTTLKQLYTMYQQTELVGIDRPMAILKDMLVLLDISKKLSLDKIV
ncbi:Smc5-6 complex non-SMC subunit Nse5 [Schizosaccharomyces pombe]|uniref:Non-structural maintenance of chromosome element 5 n=1 Tax=Schizosaccharomyces pombe (strain 972 / ATCC 24843) TaxID=284812 RepID=NSE5_SCHPO|nr:Smc5-6 complex non-SMC subunit Nse5 [Schizosaccharomyces pombe]O94668.1 RecName: Full=Non-structural maintenance of chromosome element 5; Short=Non-SMC element 5 [Schizosaccharomyces pombe 972h-]CAB37606.1 Smc5-6 complex non-SMC subunit Nse5 [Schizosaccharomyces pombe]|eukprot:NP_595508.1 Smc5-6 complex non-SMC subunit Nse5 [Schizosaccharomyces pombe]